MSKEMRPGKNPGTYPRCGERYEHSLAKHLTHGDCQT